MTPRARPEARDHGQTAPLMTAMLVITAAVLLVAVEVGRLLDDGVRASTAADAAALAGAAQGRAEAASIAAANGATLVSYIEERHDDGASHASRAEEEIDDGAGSVFVTVSVRVGRATRTARAEGVTEWTTPQ